MVFYIMRAPNMIFRLWLRKISDVGPPAGVGDPLAQVPVPPHEDLGDFPQPEPEDHVQLGRERTGPVAVTIK